eukprot:TRINITY_DN28712_c0_g1_i1.p1 TRINITY_DN28712_c0_g1~~TRINITY_DN28712_c0_g1_i1.p1  ORF type:complete len:429 (+),score=43.30 TRINITY_DN28712_c0_g1_i1:207-1493(+)
MQSATVAAETATLYMQDQIDRNVFVYTPAGDGTWRFSRLSACQISRNNFMLVYTPPLDSRSNGWALHDRSVTAGVSKDAIIGCPRTNVPQDPRGPPLGAWIVWGIAFILTDQVPTHPPPSEPFQVEVPFAKFSYSERGAAARLDITLKKTPIEDDCFEDMLRQLQKVLRNLASRPHMALFIRSDAQDCAVPAVRHIKRYLAFIQENGTEFVLAGRGHAIVVKPQTLLGTTVVGIVKMIQRVIPPPWPETIVPSFEDAEAFLGTHASKFVTTNVEKMVPCATDKVHSDPIAVTTNSREPSPSLVDAMVSPRSLSTIIAHAATGNDEATASGANFAVQEDEPKPPKDTCKFVLAPEECSDSHGIGDARPDLVRLNSGFLGTFPPTWDLIDLDTKTPEPETVIDTSRIATGESPISILQGFFCFCFSTDSR